MFTNGWDPRFRHCNLPDALTDTGELCILCLHMVPSFTIHLGLAVAAGESLALAALLAARARRMPGAWLLTLFLLGVAVWIAGNELPSWLGPSVIPQALHLLATASLTAAIFLHFTLVFCHARAPRWLPWLIYLPAVAAMAASFAVPPGMFVSWFDFPWFFAPNRLGWSLGVIWALFSLAGHGVLGFAFMHEHGIRRRQIAAVFAASACGLGGMLGYAFAAFGLPLRPYPLLALPLYPLILVYGILRYELMVVNAWARRAINWTLLVGLAGLGGVGLALLVVSLAAGHLGQPTSVPSLAAAIVAGALMLNLLVRPVRFVAERIVYPGSRITGRKLDDWRRHLDEARNYPQLALLAETELSRHLHMPVAVVIAGETGHGRSNPDAPRLECQVRSGRWRVELTGWQEAPPGQRYAAWLFGGITSEAAIRLEYLAAMSERERERQHQARLAELGTLAATVAHDIRNPLNIIKMASAGTQPKIRQEIAVQVDRVSQLASDLLDYARLWRIDARPLDLAALVREAVAQARLPGAVMEMPAHVPVRGDPRRLRQMLANLLDNARASGARATLLRAAVTPDGSVTLDICDNGTGIPVDIREMVFHPFISRSPEGTGLGLAIVARIMEAHGGRVALGQAEGWNTCFSLSFPPPIAEPHLD